MHITSTKLIICDVCDTLYRSNTTFDFLRFLFSANKKKLLALELMSSKWSPLYYLIGIAAKIIHKDLVRTFSLQLLAGRSYDEVTRQAQLFYNEFLLKRSNSAIFEILEKERSKFPIILLSSSIDPVVKTIGDRNNFDFLSSALEIKDGIITGKLTRDLTQQKHLHVKDLMKVYGTDKLLVITDNRSDFELVKMADERYVIIKTNRDKEYWMSLKPNYITAR